MKFTNMTTKEQYEKVKRGCNFVFEYVPHTATGYEDNRKYITINEPNRHKYFLSAVTDKDFYLSEVDEGAHYSSFSVWFYIDGDTVTIKEASENGRSYKADKFLKRYVSIVNVMASIIKYDGIIKYHSYCGM